MTNLTREETVWLQAYCAYRGNNVSNDAPMAYANYVLKHFKETFHPSPPQQKESEGVYVTKEMLAKAWNEKRGTHGPHDFERFCKALGLGHE